MCLQAERERDLAKNDDGWRKTLKNKATKATIQPIIPAKLRKPTPKKSSTSALMAELRKRHGTNSGRAPVLVAQVGT
jgi:hypothetical protein